METLELQGAKLRYHQVGQGPVLILLPGANWYRRHFSASCRTVEKAVYCCSVISVVIMEKASN